MLTDKQTKNRKMNRRNCTISLSSLNSIGQRIFELQSGKQNVDGQMDNGHINLIGGLVTCNPPKNGSVLYSKIGTHVKGAQRMIPILR